MERLRLNQWIWVVSSRQTHGLVVWFESSNTPGILLSPVKTNLDPEKIGLQKYVPYWNILEMLALQILEV
jgi:hypothetical protein